MSDYTPDIFYNTQPLDFETKKAIIHDAKALCYDWHVDKLDCAVSFARQRIEMPFEEVMKKFNNSCHFSVIHRRGLEDNGSGIWKWNLDVSFRTMALSEPDHFLYVHVEEKHIPELIENFHLKPVQQ